MDQPPAYSNGVSAKQDRLPLTPQARINQTFGPVPQRAPAANGFFTVDSGGLLGEADTWQHYSGEMGAIADMMAGARLTTSPLGPFEGFASRLANETSRLESRCLEAQGAMADISQQVRAVKQRYGALDGGIGASYDTIGKAT